LRGGAIEKSGAEGRGRDRLLNVINVRKDSDPFGISSRDGGEISSGNFGQLELF